MNLKSVTEILQTLKNANNFEINGTKFNISSVNENEIANTLALLLAAKTESKNAT